MRISTKCSVALHLLVLIHVFGDRKLTGETMARSTGCNPVMVRTLLGNLKKAGIIEVRRGPGGATPLRKAEDITVLDVFEAVDGTPLEDIIGLHPSPNPACPVGRNIYSLLDRPYGRVAESVRAAMQSCTLKQLIEDYSKIEQPPVG